ncbi:MAG: response regulator [Prosthecobacter sp.]
MNPETSNPKARILIVDDHRVMLEGYQFMLNAQQDMAVCATATSATAALAAVERERPDLVITDLTMGGRGGLELTKDLLAVHPSLKILVCPCRTPNERCRRERLR